MPLRERQCTHLMLLVWQPVLVEMTWETMSRHNCWEGPWVWRKECCKSCIYMWFWRALANHQQRWTARYCRNRSSSSLSCCAAPGGSGTASQTEQGSNCVPKSQLAIRRLLNQTPFLIRPKDSTTYRVMFPSLDVLINLNQVFGGTMATPRDPTIYCPDSTGAGRWLKIQVEVSRQLLYNTQNTWNTENFSTNWYAYPYDAQSSSLNISMIYSSSCVVLIEPPEKLYRRRRASEHLKEHQVTPAVITVQGSRSAMQYSTLGKILGNLRCHW